MEHNLRKTQHDKRFIYLRIGIVTVVLASLFLASYYYIKANQHYNSYEVRNTFERTDSSSVQYVSMGTQLLKYSRDGAMLLDGKGDKLWNGTYDMKEPKADVCGGYVAIADIGGKTVYVYDDNGKQGMVETLLPIIEVKVAKQGVVVVLMQDKEGNKFSIYNPYDAANPLLFDASTNTDDGYPIDIDLSEDGKKLVTSYLTIKNGVTENTVNFYSFSEVGQNAIDCLKGAFIYKQTVIPKVEFLTNDIVGVFAENRFALYSMKEEPKLIKEIKLPSEIRSIFYDSKHVGFVVENLEGTAKHKILVYNLSGNESLNKTVDYDYKTVRLYNDEIIFLSDLEGTILKLSGKEKFHGTFDKTVSYLMPAKHLNRYFLINDANVEEIGLTEE